MRLLRSLSILKCIQQLLLVYHQVDWAPILAAGIMSSPQRSIAVVGRAVVTLSFGCLNLILRLDGLFLAVTLMLIFNLLFRVRRLPISI